ncbi:hypothetical protein [Bradyrhizobium sp. 150]|uniref:hypothetical protein n=1 Tax=Bradyrhizobium sp. 150 TaxID=2782625 RepID=UPI001FFA6198|nr:hypothetical protein [Bradyrhizobium sp. 150]MCK1672796.1 hypothetical protein [Bradyrhizobium sp. 150]
MNDTTMPTTSEAAQAALNVRIADPDWGARLLANDPATRSDWENLSRIAAGDAEAIASAKTAAPSSGDPPKSLEQLAAESDAEARGRQVTSLVDTAREKFEISSGVEEQLRSGAPVTQAEFDAVSKLRSQRMNDPGWSARFLKGDPVAAQESFLMSIVLSSEIKQKEEINK